MQENEKDINQNQEANEQENNQQEPKIDVVKGIEMLENQLIETQNSLEKVQKELEINNETFKRTLAEYDNFKIGRAHV